jgi:hypothetical protein
LLSSRPYVTAGATTLLLLVMWNSGRDVFESDGEHGWLNWFVVAFVLYALIVSLVVVPRWLAPKVSAEGHEGRLFVIGVAFAVAPFLVAFASAGAGSDTWAMTLGLSAARRRRHPARSERGAGGPVAPVRAPQARGPLDIRSDQEL